MFNIIERYMEKLTIEDVNNFASKNHVHLNEEELNFTYIFVKKNWMTILKNPNLLNLDKYKEKFSEENFLKIQKLVKEYTMRYKNYL